jgi:quercetin dioxygenase-like cupin family protein
MISIDTAPRVQHRAEAELPFVPMGEGQHVQLLQVDLDHGLWIVRARFEPGTTIPRHLHTGSVFAFTISGSWHYLEYPEVVNTEGSYLFEPAGSVHTLHVPASNEQLTDVWFAIDGANLNLREDDSVEMVIDAATILAYYRAVCEGLGISDPPVIGA